MTNSNSEIVFQPLPSDDPLTREPDSTKAKLHLGWEPVVERKIGLERTIEHFTQELTIQSHS